MAGYKGQQGRKPKASTIADRRRKSGDTGGGEQPAGRLPNAPPHLSKVAKAEWTRVGRQLRDAGLLTSLDVQALAIYCTAYAQHIEAQAMLNGPPGFCPNCVPGVEDGGMSVDKVIEAIEAVGRIACKRPYHMLPEYGRVVRKKGALVASPYIAINKEAISQMRQFLAEFGMTPASRSRIPKEKDPERRPRRPAPVASPNEEEDPRQAFEWQVQAGRN